MAFKTGRSLIQNIDHKQFVGRDNYDASTPPSNEGKITAIDGNINDYFGGFGDSIAIGDGKIVVGSKFNDGVGADSGAAYIFDLDRNYITKITASDGVGGDNFGNSVAVGCDRIVIGSLYADPLGLTNAGAAYIFDLNGNFINKITAFDAEAVDIFGSSVAVGNGRIVIGSPYDDDNGLSSGSVYIFDLNGRHITKITAPDGASNDEFGETVAVDCGRIVVGATGAGISGAAYIFDLDGNYITKITSPDGVSGDNFGNSVAVGNGRIVIGAPFRDDFSMINSGAAYIFDLDGNYIAKITSSDAFDGDVFGQSVAVGDGRIVVGCRSDDDVFEDSGSVFIFDLDGNQITKITASDPAIGDYFGYVVAVGSGRIAIASPYDDDKGSNSGSVYVYETPKQTHILDILEEY